MAGMDIDAAIAMYAQPDPKPEPRVVDKRVYKRFHEQVRSCLCCTFPTSTVQAHHLLLRSQGGDDVLENLIPLCEKCHQAYHGTSYVLFNIRITQAMVRGAIGGYLLQDEGQEALSYLRSKRSDGWISKRFGVDL